ncbi:hypothetical protein PTTG_04439 [Puccinia triticina 1-1 BBBD Race 1]|uniref:Gluconate 5-dehydrogenase n=2 Tax=Puccinia triticina TaxID=208348 RepID=A0A180G804_PUCT1|nr:uncharacterized protein PtA15_6A110 [Puccinia triticina]OAV88825.1 hypothetical protein PTTG_04439 [Puccinia triticina 1-1 BBBD Race 1]WAQ85482.1 hypothetical protein PtA15_6A110 [Puccinia triticina]WAR55363.1 hypothetical protein PtB15_6B103 [Puccinia triticina]
MCANFSSLKIENLFGLQGRVAVITGGSKGLGEILARAWVVNGGHALITSRTEQTLLKLCQELNQCGPGKAEYVVGDLSSKAGCLSVCAEIKKRFQKIHVLVNNAGTILSAPFDNVPEKEGWDDVFDLNVKAVFFMTSELTPELEKDATNLDPGRVVVISSAAAFNFNTEPLRAFGISGKGNWSYKASKGAAVTLSTNLAVTLGPKFITVNTICPGFYPSNMTKTLFDSIGESIDKEHPMGRSGTPEDLAGVFLFLTSRAGAHVSANHILSDGGAIAAGKFT